jgi:predicted phage tail protein
VFEERNNSAKLQSAREKTALSKPTLQEFEREVMQTRSKLRTSSQKSGKKRVTHRQQRETTTQTSSHSKSVQHAEVYPNTYQSAQEKVNAILRQMRGAN